MSATSADAADPQGPAVPLETAATEVTADVIETLASTGGYAHPLFQRREAEDAGPARPLPGQGLLLLMGGLVEQSGALDHAVAMLEIRRVAFRQMVVAGTSVRVRLRPGESRTTRSGKVLQDWEWTAVDGDDEVLATAEVLMMVNASPEETP